MCWVAFSAYAQTYSELIVFDCNDVRILKLYHLQSALVESWHKRWLQRRFSWMGQRANIWRYLCWYSQTYAFKFERVTSLRVSFVCDYRRGLNTWGLCGSARTLLWLLDATLVLPQLLRPAGNLYNLFHPHLRARSLPRRWAHTLQNPLPPVTSLTKWPLEKSAAKTGLIKMNLSLLRSFFYLL